MGKVVEEGFEVMVPFRIAPSSSLSALILSLLCFAELTLGDLILYKAGVKWHCGMPNGQL